MAAPSFESLSAAHIAADCRLSSQARDLLHKDQSPDGFVIALRNAARYQDALFFIARWLGKREAVWWGCQCLWELARSQPDSGVEAGLQDIVHWVTEPSEATRRRCETVAEEFTAGRPIGMLAMAAFGSGGSLAPANLPAAAAPEHLTADCVSAALLMAGAADPDLYRLFVFLGIDIGHGQNLWH
ncbi:MAG: hypothetical protein AB7K24_34610 [Gemmataceae bacterium]